MCTLCITFLKSHILCSKNELVVSKVEFYTFREQKQMKKCILFDSQLLVILDKIIQLWQNIVSLFQIIITNRINKCLFSFTPNKIKNYSFKSVTCLKQNQGLKDTLEFSKGFRCIQILHINSEKGVQDKELDFGVLLCLFRGLFIVFLSNLAPFGSFLLRRKATWYMMD